MERTVTPTVTPVDQADNPNYIPEERVKAYIKFFHTIQGPLSNADLTMGRALEALAVYAYSRLPLTEIKDLSWSDLEQYLPEAFSKLIRKDKSRLSVLPFRDANEFRFSARYSISGIPVMHKVEFYLDAPELD